MFFFGDLNYRVTDLPNNQVKKYIAENDLHSILIHDQLNKQKELGKILDVSVY